MHPSSDATASHPSDAAELRQRLHDPRHVCGALGLLDGYKPGRQAGGGLLIRCPAHNERTPSCSVRRGRDGTIAVACFGCGFTGDVLTLVAVARGLDVRADFPAVLGEAARLAGMAPTTPRPRQALDTGPLGYPPAGEVAALWQDAYPLAADKEARVYLAKQRKIDPGPVDLYDLARVIQPWANVPTWACCWNKSWVTTHRLILPVFDHLGAMRSLRAWRVSRQGPEDGAPKRSNPSKHTSSGLVLACPVARRMLATGKAPSWAVEGALFDVIIAEGEPDFLTWATQTSDADETPPAVLGIASGSWCEAFADRIPDGSRVVIRTHQDAAGDRYAAAIRASLAGRSVTVFDLERGHSGEAA